MATTFLSCGTGLKPKNHQAYDVTFLQVQSGIYSHGGPLSSGDRKIGTCAMPATLVALKRPNNTQPQLLGSKLVYLTLLSRSYN